MVKLVAKKNRNSDDLQDICMCNSQLGLVKGMIFDLAVPFTQQSHVFTSVNIEATNHKSQT